MRGYEKCRQFKSLLDAHRLFSIKISRPYEAKYLVSLSKREKHYAFDSCFNKCEIPRIVYLAVILHVFLVLNDSTVVLAAYHIYP